jgi:hypothetical protein
MKKPLCHVLEWRPNNSGQILVCFKCGQEQRAVQFAEFVSNGVRDVRRSTGNGQAMVQYFHPWCYKCRKAAILAHRHNPANSPEMQRYWSRRISGIRRGCVEREILCLIDQDDLLRACLDQSARCALTGRQMTFDMGGKERLNTQASVDRIDSAGNYEIGNIQIVCNAVNIMKSNMTSSEFFAWCASVVRHKVDQDDALLASIDAGTRL